MGKLNRETILAADLTKKYELDPKLTPADIRALGRDDYYIAAANALARLYGRERTVQVVKEARQIIAGWAALDRRKPTPSTAPATEPAAH